MSIDRSAICTPDAAAILLGIKPTALRNWQREGRGPVHVREGGRTMYRLADLQSFALAAVSAYGLLQPQHGGGQR